MIIDWTYSKCFNHLGILWVSLNAVITHMHLQVRIWLLQHLRYIFLLPSCLESKHKTIPFDLKYFGLTFDLNLAVVWCTRDGFYEDGGDVCLICYNTFVIVKNYIVYLFKSICAACLCIQLGQPITIFQTDFSHTQIRTNNTHTLTHIT